MAQSRNVEVRVGVFVAAALAIGASLIFVIGTRKNMFASKSQFHAVFSSVGGLRNGSPLTMSGVDVGTVGDITLRMDGKIYVDLNVNAQYLPLVRRDTVASVGSKGLLGDKLVDLSIAHGPVLAPGGTIQTVEPSDIGTLTASAGAVMADARAVAANLRVVSGALAEPQFQDDLRDSVHSLRLILHDVAEGDGIVHHALEDPEMAAHLQRTLANADVASAELARTARNAAAVTDEIRNGHGSVHQVIYGPDGARLVANVADATGEAAQTLHAIREGHGAVHDILYDDETGRNVHEAVAAAHTVMTDVAAGRGTVGAFLRDPSIYEDVKRLVGDLDRNEILRALVRYSIRHDQPRPSVDATSPN